MPRITYSSRRLRQLSGDLCHGSLRLPLVFRPHGLRLGQGIARRRRFGRSSGCQLRQLLAPCSEQGARGIRVFRKRGVLLRQSLRRKIKGVTKRRRRRRVGVGLPLLLDGFRKGTPIFRSKPGKKINKTMAKNKKIKIKSTGTRYQVYTIRVYANESYEQQQ